MYILQSLTKITRELERIENFYDLDYVTRGNNDVSFSYWHTGVMMSLFNIVLEVIVKYGIYSKWKINLFIDSFLFCRDFSVSIQKI